MRYSKDKIKSILDAAKHTDMTITEFCKKQGIKPARYYVWKRKYKSNGTKKVETAPEGTTETATLKELVQLQQGIISKLMTLQHLN